MDELFKEKEKLMLTTYLEQLCNYCNKYDNIAILNQVKAFVGEDNITLSDVYADFELVSKDEYDCGNGNGFNTLFSEREEKNEKSNCDIGHLDIDGMLRDIDKKLYKLDVEEAMEKGDSVTKVRLYINVISVDDNVVECMIKETPEDTEPIAKSINIGNLFQVEYINKIKGQWVWVRGYETVKEKESYYFLEPHWYKSDDKLTQQDKQFFESTLIIEEKNDEIANVLINSIVDDGRIEGTEKELDENGEENRTINGMVILSEPGGGKTTYLKHFIYEILSFSINKNDCILENKLFERNGLDKNQQYIPVFARTRDIADILSNDKISKECLIDTIMERCVRNIIAISDECDYEQIVANITNIIKSRTYYKILFVIDGFEELDDEKAEKLLEGLNYAYDREKLNRKDDRLIISSRYKEYGYQKLVTFCSEHAIEEKYIKFDNKSSAIDVCVSKWFNILRKTGQDNHTYFNKMRTSNSDIGNLITTPLELTGLIMLCQSQSALPTDITVLYRSIIEIWLTYGIMDASIPFFSLSDIFLELATIAYYMAESKDEKLRISRDKIKEIIKSRRNDLRRYYRSNSYVDASSEREIDELVDFWLKRNIFVKNTNEDIYEFAHREYQSYLISYAIVNNFIPKDKRKSERIKYFEEHMEQAEDFWDRVIVFSAFMSTDVHDDIIEYIFSKLQNMDTQEDGKSQLMIKNIDKYFLSIILQLTTAEGFYFADYEYEILFEELFKQDRITIMNKSVKGSEIKKLLSNGRQEINTLFLNKTIEIMEKCNADIENIKKNQSDVKLLEAKRMYKERLINIIGRFVFHITWNCDADRNTIKKAFGLYLDNWINMDIIYEIKDSLSSYRYNEDRINLIREIGIEAITRKDSPLSDCYMIISIILGFREGYEEDGGSIYEVALKYFNKAECCVDETEKNESIIIATNIVFLLTWFLQGVAAKKCNCALKDKEGNWNLKWLEEYLTCVVKITEYMKNIEGGCVYSRDLYATYRDLCISDSEELREKIFPLLFDKDVFRNCLQISEGEKLIKESDEKELAYIFEIISLYPLKADYINLSETKSILSKRVEEIEICRKSDNMPCRKELLLLKLLIFAGYFEDNGRVDTIKLESEISSLRKKRYAYIGKVNQFIFESVEKYMQDNLK